MRVYVTVRAGEQLEDFTANLRAPIVVHEGRAHQAIDQPPGAELRAPLFGERIAGPADWAVLGFGGLAASARGATRAAASWSA